MENRDFGERVRGQSLFYRKVIRKTKSEGSVANGDRLRIRSDRGARRRRCGGLIWRSVK